MEKEYKIINPTTLEGEPILEASKSNDDVFSSITVDEDGLFDDDFEITSIKSTDEGLDDDMNISDFDKLLAVTSTPHFKRGFQIPRE